jgi:hypothetical protein
VQRKKCDKCRKFNNFKSAYRSKTVHEIQANTHYDTSENSDVALYVNTVNKSLSQKDQAFALNIGPNCTQILFSIDTGSQANILQESKIKHHGIKNPLEPSIAKLSSYPCNRHKVKGTIRL